MSKCDCCDELKARLEAVEKTVEDFSKSLSGSAFPSGLRINISIPPSGDSFVAPVDGYAVLRGTSGAKGAYIAIGDHEGGLFLNRTASMESGEAMWLFVPVRKEQSIQVIYKLASFMQLYLVPPMGAIL